jgi:hypothetical protein
VGKFRTGGFAAASGYQVKHAASRRCSTRDAMLLVIAAGDVEEQEGGRREERLGRSRFKGR